jgi:hypothetical protein
MTCSTSDYQGSEIVGQFGTSVKCSGEPGQTCGFAPCILCAPRMVVLAIVVNLVRGGCDSSCVKALVLVKGLMQVAQDD